MIGQAAEFDYSGVQACKVLLEEGYEVVLVNSNPATIMTDPEFATATYIEPLTPESVAAVIERERPDALLPHARRADRARTSRRRCHEDGTLGQLRRRADRRRLRRDPARRGPRAVPRDDGARPACACRASAIVTSMRGGRARDRRDRPAADRAARRSRSAATAAASRARAPSSASACREGLNASPINQVLLEQSLIGWGEFELEVMRDRNDNALVVCSIENIDPMGVHTGDSVTVAPQQTLTDAPVPGAARPGAGGDPRGRRRDGRLQHPVRGQPGDRRGRRDRDEPARVALVGARLEGDRLPDRQDRRPAGGRLRAGGDPQRHHAPTPASFEPTIDYAVVKIPRFAFEKFPGAEGGSPRR